MTDFQHDLQGEALGLTSLTARGFLPHRELAEHVMMGLPSAMSGSLFDELFSQRNRARERVHLSDLPPAPLLKRDFSALLPGIDPDHEPLHTQVCSCVGCLPCPLRPLNRCSRTCRP